MPLKTHVQLDTDLNYKCIISTTKRKTEHKAEWESLRADRNALTAVAGYAHYLLEIELSAIHFKVSGLALNSVSPKPLVCEI